MIHKKGQNSLNLLKLLFDPEDGSNKLTFTMICRFIRETAKATQSEMAKKLNSGLSSYQEWEQGKREPSSKAAANLIFLYLQCLCFREQTDIVLNNKILSSVLLPEELISFSKQSPEKSLEVLKLLFESNVAEPLTFSSMCCLIRETMNVTQANMAERLGAAFSAYQQWEYGTRQPSSKAAANLTLMYLQCLYIRKQTPSVIEIKCLLDSLLNKTVEQICA